MKRILLLLFTSLVLLLSSGCSEEDSNRTITPPNKGETSTEVELTLRIPSITNPATRFIGEKEECEIKEVSVLIFIDRDDGNGEVYFAHYYGREIGVDKAATPDGGATYKFKTQLKNSENATDKYRLVVIANMQTAIQKLLNAGSINTSLKKAQVLELIQYEVPEDDGWNATSTTNYTPLPFWGETGKIDLPTSVQNNKLGTIYLLRAVARVDVGLNFLKNGNNKIDESSEPQGLSNFKLEEVYVYNVNKKGYVALVNGANVNTYSATPPSIPAEGKYDTPLSYDIADGEYGLKHTIYISEANLNAASMTFANATCVVLGGKYNEEGEYDGEDISYYRVEFFDPTVTDADKWLDIIRNHRYTINITKVNGSGYDTKEIAFKSRPINMEAEIVEWEEGQVGDVIFDGQYYLSVNPKTDFIFYKDGDADEDADEVYIETDVEEGFRVIAITEIDETTPNGWLTIGIGDDDTADILADGQYYGIGKKKETVDIMVEQNPTSVERKGYIFIKAGRLKAKLTVTQRAYNKRNSVFRFISFFTNYAEDDQILPPLNGTITAKVHTNMDWKFWTDISGANNEMTLPTSVTPQDYTLDVDVPDNKAWGTEDIEVWIEYQNLIMQRMVYKQLGYYIAEATVNQTVLEPHNSTTVTCSLRGVYPADEVNVRVWDTTNDKELVSEASIATDHSDSEGTGTVNMIVPPNDTWTERDVTFQYYNPETSEWVDFSTITQKGYKVTDAQATVVYKTEGGSSFVTITGYRPVLHVRAYDDDSDKSLIVETMAAGTPNSTGSTTLVIPYATSNRTVIIEWSTDGTVWNTINDFRQYASMASVFAKSNIVWTGSKLTFATTEAENKIIPANSQGVIFKWGSLVAMNPVVGRVDENIIYNPADATYSTWDAIPYADEMTVFGNDVEEEDDFATYNNNTGYDEAINKGDICRYISDQGWVADDWRLPTAHEWRQLYEENEDKAGKVGNFWQTSPSVSYGLFAVGSGYWMGDGTKYWGGDETAPSFGLYLPTSGLYRKDNTDSAKYQEMYVGTNMMYYSGTSDGNGSVYAVLNMLDAFYGMTRAGTGNDGYAVRCIRK
ncbi:BACON domain-containing protein [Bacteroides sp. 519]|uniref:BACON domain-containing protein n=1 Tax=Bacteroides sp. 519 TaxID=2302937 RepID=UPI0013D279C1|nr:BACON domain-containing carbohydrate-binding protein [Bacteroides sp. 519]NDV60270.1 hypothetical protein [Bacteroides sp. 519]